MKSLNLIIFIMLLCVSCSSYKIEHEVASVVVDRLKNPFSNLELDSIEVVNCSFVLNNEIIKLYELVKKRQENEEICVDCGNIKWIKKDNSWIFNKHDLKYLNDEIKKQIIIKWNSKKFKKKVVFINNPLLKDKFINDIERVKRIKSNNYVYYISTPIFNKNKDKAIIKCSNVFLNSSEIYIYQKINKKWELIGEFQ